MGQIDVRRLRLLRELRDRETVTAVGSALHMTSSAVSQQLALLAREVGTQLLEPHGRRVRLTPAAELLLRHADQLFAQLELARTEIDAYVSGGAATVRVDCFATAVPALVVPAMRRLAATRPQVSVRVHEADTEIALDRLARDETDLVVGLDGEVRADAPRFARTPLLVDPLDVVLPGDHPRAGAALRLAQLRDEDWILPPYGICREIALRECATAGFTPHEAHTADSYAAVFALVRAGLGVALVPRMCVDLRGPDLVVAVLEAEQPRRHVSLFTRHTGEQAPHVRAVLESFSTA